MARPSKNSSGVPSPASARRSSSSALAAPSGEIRSVRIRQVGLAAVRDCSERIDAHQSEQSIGVVGREVHTQMTTPRVSDDVGAFDSDTLQNSHGVGNVGLDVERSRRSRWSESALLVAVDRESVFEFADEWLGVFRETRATV